MKHRNIAKLVSLLAAALILTTGCTTSSPEDAIEADNLLSTVQKNEQVAVYDFLDTVTIPDNYSSYYEEICKFGVNWLKQTDPAENTLISPVSSSFMLGLLQYGSNGSTKKEVKKIFGGSSLTLDDINNGSNYLSQKISAFNNEYYGAHVVNSFWAFQDLSVKRGFLQKNENYFTIPTYNINNDDQANAKIQNQISAASSGQIVSFVPNVEKDTQLYAFSAFSLTDNWLSEFAVKDKLTFKPSSGKDQTSVCLTATEREITTSNSTGFVKTLENTPCMMIALLPNENSTLSELISSLDASFFYQLSQNIPATSFINVELPEFSLSYTQSLNTTLETLGAKTMFTENADFSRLSDDDFTFSEIGSSNIFSVTRYGIGVTEPKKNEEESNTTAENSSNSTNAAQYAEETLSFDRPFLFAVVENESGAPLFIGTVNSLE